MSNKPQSEKTSPTGLAIHDAHDVRCQGHAEAKRLKGIRPIADRVCPTCSGDSPESPAKGQARQRRRARRAVTKAAA